MQSGHIDSTDHYAIVGWAADPDYPDSRVHLRIMVNGMEHGRVIAERPRPDLKQAGTYGDGAHGFAYVFDPPLSPLHGYDVVVRYIDPPADVANGRLRIEAVRPQDVMLRPLLVTATGRSGTTLLMKRLGYAPEIVLADIFPFEMKLLTYYGCALEILTTASSPANPFALDRLTEDRYHLGLNPFHHPQFEAVYPNAAMLHRFFGPRTAARLHPAFRTIVDDFYRDMQTHFRKPQARFFAEKCDVFTPARHFARLAFEGVKELLLVRDPRDIYCSRRSFWSDSGENSMQNLKTVQATVLPLLAAERDRLLVVRYEDLILQPTETLASIVEYLGLSHPIKPRPDGEREIFAAHGTSKDPAASIGRWKHELDAEDRTALLKSFKPFLEAFHYETAGD
ncbi:MAG TPA: sulfotransferase [Acetobacteraceae bacterium]|nr:sulfotransferase [Acetobacteraceae bacterium]